MSTINCDLCQEIMSSEDKARLIPPTKGTIIMALEESKIVKHFIESLPEDTRLKMELDLIGWVNVNNKIVDFVETIMVALEECRNDTSQEKDTQ